MVLRRLFKETKTEDLLHGDAKVGPIALRCSLNERIPASLSHKALVPRASFGRDDLDETG
jgi:hypothetical protein